MDVDELKSQVEHIMNSLEDLKDNPIVGGFVPPYIGGGEIKLVIIGQDPTVKNPMSRSKIAYTLNLDKKGASRSYVEKIAECLSISMDNVYATNLFKYFYTVPPANYFKILKNHQPQNLELLNKEISDLSISVDCPIITLGEPVLQLLLEENGVSGKEKRFDIIGTTTRRQGLLAGTFVLWIYRKVQYLRKSIHSATSRVCGSSFIKIG